MLKADRAQNYKFLESMNPVNIITENKAIPSFIFEYFAQYKISELTCSFEFKRRNRMFRFRGEIEFVDQDQAYKFTPVF